METLLITACISPGEGILQSAYLSNTHKGTNDKKTLDPIQRYDIYKSNLLYYLSIKGLDNVVFCDNSSFIISKDDINFFKKVAAKNKKQLEILQFKGNALNQLKYGYAYGEQEILDYAFDHSFLIKQSESRYKISGRKKIINFEKIIKKHKNITDIFSKLDNPLIYFFCVSTYFFKISNQLYNKVFYKNIINYFINHNNNDLALEYIWYFFLRKTQSTYTGFKILPIFSFFNKKNIIIYSIFLYIGLLNNGLLELFIGFIFRNRKQAIKSKYFNDHINILTVGYGTLSSTHPESI